MEKIRTLHNITTMSDVIVVTSPAGLMEKIVSPSLLESQKVILRPDQEINFNELIRTLVNYGFTREERVDHPGEMSVRGGLIDIFLFDKVNPFRIEFFGDQIESIRSFDVVTQKSIHHVDKLEILPPGSVGFFKPFEDHPQNTCYHNTVLTDHFANDTLFFGMKERALLKKPMILKRIWSNDSIRFVKSIT